MAPRAGQASALLAGAALDALCADPRRAHPVAAFGRAAAAVERRLWADDRARGTVFTAGCVGAVVVAAALAQRSARAPMARLALLTAATWAVLGGESLAREGEAMHDLLDRDDLDGARARLRHLCGRDPGRLDAWELARATVESLAENTSDAVVAPLFWGALAGAPGLLGYRAVNTLDAMVGHRSALYARFGWASARLDDLANLLPARMTAVLVAALAPLVGGRPRRVLQVVARDGGNHPSPNAGRCEAAFAAALGVRLGGTNLYDDRVEIRGRLGDGPLPGTAELLRAVRLSRLVAAAAAFGAAGAALALGWLGGTAA